MSTKIYNAYRFVGTMAELNVLLHELREERVNTMMEDLPSGKDLWALDEQCVKDPRKQAEYEETAVVYTPENGDLLVQFFVGDRDFQRKVSQHPKLKDFHYQNQTDRDPDITDADWENRKKVWNAIFDHRDHSPAEAGFTFRLFEIKFALFRDLAKRDKAKP